MTFCDQCGARLSTQCHTCGVENRLGAKFCHACATSLTSSAAPHGQQEFHARLYVVLPAVIGLLQSEKRVSYGALKQIFGFDERLLREVRAELLFKRLAIDEEGKGLV